MFGETLSNPTMEVLDIEKFASIAHAHGVPLIVDNTLQHLQIVSLLNGVQIL